MLPGLKVQNIILPSNENLHPATIQILGRGHSEYQIWKDWLEMKACMKTIWKHTFLKIDAEVKESGLEGRGYLTQSDKAKISLLFGDKDSMLD